ncbi:MAG: MBL fold metallo-hydrolase [Planctomycetes bacterium]|nr:MBL fold metallo-hydrolase [Planctomycetota bacterium]
MSSATTITMFGAGKGDSLLVEHSAVDRTRILIDGGYASSFGENVLPVLQALRASKQQLDLLVTTHIDADHISGIVALLKGNGDANFPKIVPISHVWHNTPACCLCLAVIRVGLVSIQLGLQKCNLHLELMRIIGLGFAKLRQCRNLG